MKEVAPSDELRRWFAHQPEKWAEFRQRYTEGLRFPAKAKLVVKLTRLASDGKVTLVYAAGDTEHNNARVLEEIIVRQTNAQCRSCLINDSLSERRLSWLSQANMAS